MLIFGIVLAIIFILLVLFLFLKFSVILSIKKGNLEIRLKVFGLKFKIPLEKKSKKEAKKPLSDEDSVMKKFMDLRNNFNRVRPAVSKTLSYLQYKIELCDIGVLGDFGTGDAATTGIAFGSVHALLGAVSSLIGQFFTLKNPIMTNVELDFSKPVFNLSLHAKIKARPIHLLTGILMYFKTLKKAVKT